MKAPTKFRGVVVSICLAFIATGIVPFDRAMAQRLEQPPPRDIEGTTILPAGTNVIPAGTVLVLEMMDRLSSNKSLSSDRFSARVVVPVIDGSGRTLIPSDSVVEGFVSLAVPAQWRRRSGVIGLAFDYLRLPDGRQTPIRGFLTTVDADDRKRLDEEGNLKAGSELGLDFVFVGGGAGTGAAIGAIAGSALAGLGIGAAVGVTATLLRKGKEAVVNPGQRFGIELTSPLRPGSAGIYDTGSRPIYDTRVPEPLGPQLPSQQPSLVGGSVNVSDVRAERGSDGFLRILITAQTDTSGWRIFTNYETIEDTVTVRVRGMPTERSTIRQISHPTAPVIAIRDNNYRIRRVIVQGRNGTRTLELSGSTPGTVYRPSPTPVPGPGTGTDVPYRPPVDYTNQPPGSSTGQPQPGSTTELATLASQVSNQIEQIRYDFGASIGVWINRDGTYDNIGQRNPTADEKRLLDSLGALQNSVRTLNMSLSNAASRRSNAARVQEDAKTVEQVWMRISMSQQLNEKVRKMLVDTTSLVRAAQ